MPPKRQRRASALGWAALFAAFITFANLGASARPALAAEQTTAERVAAVKAELTAASARASDLEQQIAQVQAAIDRRQTAISAERLQVRGLARDLYAQPSSFPLIVLESGSLSEAINRWSDLVSAGERAATLKRRLEADLKRLAQERSQLQADRSAQQDAIDHLNHQFQQLQSDLEAEAAAAAAAAAAAPPATTPPPSFPTGSIQAIIIDAFTPLGQGAVNWALRVAYCESHYNPYAVNSSSGAAGLFQFLPSTWAHSPYASQSPFDPVANSRAAAWLYARSGPNQWVCQ